MNIVYDILPVILALIIAIFLGYFIFIKVDKWAAESSKKELIRKKEREKKMLIRKKEQDKWREENLVHLAGSNIWYHILSFLLFAYIGYLHFYNGGISRYYVIPIFLFFLFTVFSIEDKVDKKYESFYMLIQFLSRGIGLVFKYLLALALSILVLYLAYNLIVSLDLKIIIVLCTLLIALVIYANKRD